MLDALKTRLAERADTHVGLLAEFENPGALYDAVKALRKQGYNRLDTFSPFPIHGMDGAMGLGVSPLGFLAFAGGLTGLALATWLQWWTSEVDYPINISNKPLFAWEPSVPVMFELTILFTALAIVGGMLAMNGLPQPYNPLFHSERFGRATDDGFFLHVGRADRAFDRAATAGHLFALGATAVEYVDHDGATAVDAAGVAALPERAAALPPLADTPPPALTPGPTH